MTTVPLSFRVVRATQAVLTSPTVLRKSAVGLATQAIQNPEALVQKYLATYVRPATASLTAAAAVTDLRRPERKPEAFVQNVVLRRKIPMVISACRKAYLLTFKAATVIEKAPQKRGFFVI